MIIMKIVIILIIALFLPIGLIWAINTLFMLNIPISFTTWMAAFILSAPFASTGD